ncbi:MAG: methionine--tRNA ligase [Clostridia bacterium]
MSKQKYYITTPIYYPSGTFHVGHCYCTVVADTIARYKRLRGYDVFFLTGTDEHGQKIERKAKDNNETPKEYVDKIVVDTKDLWKKLGITYDKYIRTTDLEHEECVKKVFQKLYDKGDIYLDSYEGKYCTPCEAFWTETQLIDGKCPDCQREVELLKEESYFFKLSKYQEKLITFYNEHPDFLEPESRKNEMIKNFFEKGLEDLCVSRTTINWGIKVPFDKKHTVYVWLDALINYISALGYASIDNKNMEKYWPADLHLVGKEIFRFHSIVWPALLMALDLELPKKIYGHGWLIVDGAKISKSLGNYKDPRLYIDQTSADSLRHFLLHEVTFGQDGNFSEELFLEKSNAELSNDLGNLVSRVTAMVEKYNNGIIVKAENVLKEDIDIDLRDLAVNMIVNVEKQMDELKINDAISTIWQVISKANKYIDLSTPWILSKENKKERLDCVLYNLVETIRIITIALQMYMIETPARIFEQIGVEKDIISWNSAKEFGKLKDGTKVKKGINLFPRIDLKKENIEMEETKKQGSEEMKNIKEIEKTEEKGYITIDELEKTELKVGQIIKVERIEKADKLYKLSVDIGDKTRTIVSGLVPYYKEEELIGKQIVVVVNLKPIKLRGVESQGMLLAAGDSDVVKLLTLDNNTGDLENGTTIH